MMKVIGPSLLSSVPFEARLNDTAGFFEFQEVDMPFVAGLVLCDSEAGTRVGFGFRLLLSPPKVNAGSPYTC